MALKAFLMHEFHLVKQKHTETIKEAVKCKTIEATLVQQMYSVTETQGEVILSCVCI